MMALLKQLGGFFSLVSTENGRMLHTRRNFYCEDSSIIDGVMTNDAYVRGLLEDDDRDFDNFIQNRDRLMEELYTVERCKSMEDFLIVTRDEFDGVDADQKKEIFGKEFKNIDCPSVVRACFRCCTMGQTFNDDFSLTTRRTFSDKRLTLINDVISPCVLAIVRLLMMCFIHKFMQNNYFVRLNVEASYVHCWIGESVYFHDHLIDLFIEESEDPRESGKMNRNDIYIIFDRRVIAPSSSHLCVFIYVGEYLESNFVGN